MRSRTAWSHREAMSQRLKAPARRAVTPAAPMLASPERLAAITKGLTTSREHLRAAKEDELDEVP